MIKPHEVYCSYLGVQQEPFAQTPGRPGAHGAPAGSSRFFWLYGLPAVATEEGLAKPPPFEIVDFAWKLAIQPDVRGDAPPPDGSEAADDGSYAIEAPLYSGEFTDADDLRWYHFSSVSSVGYHYSVARAPGGATDTYYFTVDGCYGDEVPPQDTFIGFLNGNDISVEDL